MARTTKGQANNNNNNNNEDDGPQRRSPSCCGILMILSPAKTLDLKSEIPLAAGNRDLDWTQPRCGRDQTNAIATAVKRWSTTYLNQTLKISTQLGQTVAEYWKNFAVGDDDADSEHQHDAAAATTADSAPRPCIYTYSGAAYQGLDVTTCSREEVLYLQQHLRILSAVYGVLRPLDQIQPYRLEMGTTGLVLPSPSSDFNHNNDMDKKKKTIKLAQYWSEAVTECLSQDLLALTQVAHAAQDNTGDTNQEDGDNDGGGDGPILLNLASDEYAAAVNFNALFQRKQHNSNNHHGGDGGSGRCVKVVFREGNKRVVAVHAKRARGLLVRYMAEHAVHDLHGVRAFDWEGYRLVPEQSDETTLVFQRSPQAAPTTKAVATKKRAGVTTTTITTRGSKKSKG